ncbi:beta-glucan synthesis-associated [Dendrothele bispora CBS 962.96]|uniref:Beta-glucan synthesis-associated n=1 Tax=Dendrothele bispora (strain CBS 962.96) TaxID=1314807 RepID=A0A4S8KVK5_DENBC|nr:beta-glucan synthesis-associated [Dendrothele bispora CBS 962.96]
MNSLARDPSRQGRGMYTQASVAPSSASLISNSSYRNSGGSNSSFGSPAYSNPFLRGPGSIRSVASRETRETHASSDSPYSVPASNGRSAQSHLSSISDKYSLSADPQSWGTNLSLNSPEADDFLHNPDPKRDLKNDSGGSVFNERSFSNLGCLILLGVALVGLFAGYPLASYFTRHPLSKFGAFNVGGLNASGQVPELAGNWGLIDLETPDDARTFTSYTTQEDLVLVFSDEFNTDGRTFYPGDDPYWEAVNLHYWQTNNLEWYDPSAITTKDGSLEITLSKFDDITENYNLTYRGGYVFRMMSTWNKFCFTGGLIQVSTTFAYTNAALGKETWERARAAEESFTTSVQLPGADNILGLWPAVWTMGNLGRAGYGASLEGMWPYSYDSCDVGTLPNQTLNGAPAAALTSGQDISSLSFLPGQRLSRCTCPGESHPGPVHKDGTYVGRSAPEIDIIEAQVADGVGHVSQSGQWAPFDASYVWKNTTDTFTIYDDTVTQQNSYLGGVFQQATSCVSITGFDNAYITWINNGKAAWTLKAEAVGANSRTEIAARPVPQEPMYIIANLGISLNFGDIDFEHLTFPTVMRIDWIRVYQPSNAVNIGCDPTDFPTKAYIEEYIEAYTNPNLTTWHDDFKQTVPKNKLVDQC